MYQCVDYCLSSVTRRVTNYSNMFLRGSYALKLSFVLDLHLSVFILFMYKTLILNILLFCFHSVWGCLFLCMICGGVVVLGGLI